ncbi:BLUF domain-containing protein [Sphingomonas sp. PAMC 26621]|uniref:BLUF domain-containing protein n=1 Tax=Sphingomonas sp. PAMC 26621 TaxID=1112213 RepID=UPI0009DA8916
MTANDRDSNNARDDLTTLLVYHGRSFLYALEGPAAAINKTNERIKLDTRHRASVKLST